MHFVVLGAPIGKGRPKFSTFNGRAIAYTPQKTVNYENLVKISFQQSGEKAFDKSVQLTATIKAFFSIPKSVSKSKRDLMLNGYILPTKKPDTDNIAKSVLDALNGLAYYDDAQICELHVYKAYSEMPRVEVFIDEII